MRWSQFISKHATSLFLAAVLAFLLKSENNHAFAQTADLDSLFNELQNEELENWQGVEEKIWREWGRSGSDAMDFLLERGREAMAQGRYDIAIGHLSALIDHAPEFAEGWNARATAFFMANEYGLSMLDIQQTLRLNPRHFGALAGMASILEQTDRQTEALDVYRRALALHPHQEQVKQAIERLEKATEGTAL